MKSIAMAYAKYEIRFVGTLLFAAIELASATLYTDRIGIAGELWLSIGSNILALVRAELPHNWQHWTNQNIYSAYSSTVAANSIVKYITNNSMTCSCILEETRLLKFQCIYVIKTSV